MGLGSEAKGVIPCQRQRFVLLPGKESIKIPVGKVDIELFQSIPVFKFAGDDGILYLNCHHAIQRSKKPARLFSPRKWQQLCPEY